MQRLYPNAQIMISQHDIHSTLESTFTAIQQTRMDGVPVMNDKLSVKAIGFHIWNNNQLGILITPWFMNLMLLSQDTFQASNKQKSVDHQGIEIKEQSKNLKVGSIQPHVFPSGAYDFVVGYEEGIGHYQSCSLFSPMFEFEDQTSAELTAKEALAAIMNEDNIDFASQSRDNEIEQIWKGEKAAPAVIGGFASNSSNPDSNLSANPKSPKKPQKGLSERIIEGIEKGIDEPTSRRDFLRGKIFSTNAKDKV